MDAEKSGQFLAEKTAMPGGCCYLPAARTFPNIKSFHWTGDYANLRRKKQGLMSRTARKCVYSQAIEEFAQP